MGGIFRGQSSETKAMAEQEQRRPSGEREKEGAPKTENEGTTSGSQSEVTNYIEGSIFYWCHNVFCVI